MATTDIEGIIKLDEDWGEFNFRMQQEHKEDDDDPHAESGEDAVPATAAKLD